MFCVEESPFLSLYFHGSSLFILNISFGTKKTLNFVDPFKHLVLLIFCVYSHVHDIINPSNTTPHRHRQITRPTAPAVLREEQREHVERLNYLVHHVQIGRSPSHLHVLYCNGRQASDTGCHYRVHRLRAGMRDEKSQQPTHARL